MPIRVSCPKCGNVLKAPDAAAGKRGKCAKCGAVVPIPAAPSPSAAPPSTATPPVADIPTASPVDAKPASPPKPPTEETFDVDIEDDDPPPAPVRTVPVVPAASAPAVPVTVVAAVAPASAPAASPPPAADVWSSLGPPVDPAAAPLASDDRGDTPEVAASGEKLPPLHPGWREASGGLGMVKNAVYAMFLSAVLVAVASVTLGLASSVGIGFLIAAGVVSFVSLVILLVGLVRCVKMPPDEEGGAGRTLAMLTLGLVAGGLLLSCIGIGGLAFLAVPFAFGMFLRTIGKELPDPAASQSAMRYMIVTGLAMFAGIIAMIVSAVAPAILLSNGVSQTVVLVVLLASSVFVLAANLLSLTMLLMALAAARRAIDTALRTRGVNESLARTAPVSKAAKKRSGDVQEEAEDAEPEPAPEPPKPAARRRGKKPATSSDDDYNPFA